jgi:hypothetical protein
MTSSSRARAIWRDRLTRSAFSTAPAPDLSRGRPDAPQRGGHPEQVASGMPTWLIQTNY